MDEKKLIKIILAVTVPLFTFVLLVVGFYYPLNYYIEMPGPVEALDSFVRVEGKEDDFKGSFNITTVSERQATPFFYWYAKGRAFYDIVKEEEAFGDATPEEYLQMNEYYMLTSQNAAKVQALKLAKQPYQVKFKGVYVMAIDSKSSFFDKLQVGDTVTGVDNQTFQSSKDLVESIRQKKVGDKITVQYTHGEKKESAEGALIELEDTKKPGVGIRLVDNTEIESEIPITYNSNGITGPSGGLMLTLETYTKVTGRDIRHGQKIAGTGTMDFDGNVGRIGGIDKKVVSASKSGASIFFAPDDEITEEMKKIDKNLTSNYEEAKKAAKEIKTDMKIVPVKTAEDALKYLEAMN